MLAIVLTFFMPVLPLLLWKCWNREKKINREEVLLRYLVYGAVIVLLAAMMLAVTSDDDTSLWRKLTLSGAYSLKFICMVTAVSLAAAGAEWVYSQKKIRAALASWEGRWKQATWGGGEGSGAVSSGGRLGAFALYGLAIMVVVLNVSLMFDNVLWGDEAFSANTAEKSLFGILQVLYYWDNHPPLHYYWLKLFGELFGFSVPVLHLASLVPFFVGILLAVTVFRKKFGPLPTAFFVLISGLGPACLEYNLEVRMYSLAFLGILGTFWSAYRIISSGKRSAWTGMVLWGLMAAYSHYYALVVAGIMIFFTGAVYWVKYRGSTWRKGLLAIAAFLLGYAPWLFFLFTATSNVSGNWWVSELLGLDRVFNMVLGNMGLGKILMPLWMLLLAVVLLADSRIKNWSDEACTMAIGALTIGATIVFAYLLCFVMGQNVLQERYLYPLTAVTIFMLVLGSSRVLALLREYSEGAKLPCLETFAKTAMVTVLSVLLGLAIGNYKEYAGETRLYDEGTETTLEIIGEPEADVNFVSNGVQHLAWTVLYHYYPGNKIISGNYAGDNGGRFWYFTPDPLSEGDLERLEGEGITVLSYGENILARYSFELYYMEKTETAAAETAGDWTITQYGPREINSGFYTIYHPGKGLILVDGGWEEDADYVREQIHALGGKVDFWILTHPHQDHVGAFTEIYRNLQDIEIGEIYTVKMPEPARCLEVASWDDMTAYENFLALNVENLQYVSPGDVLDLLGLEFRIYNAFDSAVEELSGDYLNDGSMMFEVMGEKTSFLFCADVGKNMSDHLLEKWGEALQADYLQMGHHGYGGLQDDFYEMVSPDIAFFDAPESMMQDDTGRYDNPENAALMESLGSQVISFGQAPYTLVLE